MYHILFMYLLIYFSRLVRQFKIKYSSTRYAYYLLFMTRYIIYNSAQLINILNCMISNNSNEKNIIQFTFHVFLQM